MWAEDTSQKTATTCTGSSPSHTETPTVNNCNNTLATYILILMVCSTKPLLGHHALVRVVGFRMAGFMLSGSGIRVCVLGNVELGWGGWGKVQFNVGG